MPSTVRICKMITIKKKDYEKIIAHAKRCLPEEACGLIAGREVDGVKHIEEIYLLENICLHLSLKVNWESSYVLFW